MTSYYKEYLWREFLSTLNEHKIVLCLTAVVCAFKHLAILEEEIVCLIILIAVIIPRKASRPSGTSNSTREYALLPLSSRELYILNLIKNSLFDLIFYGPVLFLLFSAWNDFRIGLFIISLVSIGFFSLTYVSMKFLPQNREVSSFLKTTILSKYFLAVISCVLLLLALLNLSFPVTRDYNFTFAVILFQIIALSYMYVERDALFFNEKRYKTTERFVLKRDLSILSIILIAFILVGSQFHSRMNQRKQEIIRYEK
ncbi:hypothetical protein DOM21_12515 [Bacteriovorax stolpii]|uniref:hypothetical protein n=1 Tax=Bacteriovorax stolpii TaxID=960 RepID=UPI001159ABEC|nr:hypothetical protein [Bacteriovorax stolpii]QDK42249.1 hypothetical protein DOM21_12515 [Bacteriovorax stolpii]